MQELLLVTGLSGAGKSLVMRALEDINYFCIDNLPADMLCDLLKTKELKKRYADKLAITVDIRSGEDFQGILTALEQKTDNFTIKLLFLDADDNILAHRYKETRRCHPLTVRRNLSIVEALIQERQLLSPLYGIADYIIDTGLLSAASLREQVALQFSHSIFETMPVTVMSYGFKYGIPRDADLIFDVRCLPNPYYIPTLRDKTGLTDEVYDYVFSFDASNELFERLIYLLNFSLPLYIKEGKSRLTIAIGCTGGKHRSISFARRISSHLEDLCYKVDTLHRDETRHKRNY